MARIIPGVEVTVVKEVVPKQLAPSGVLGIVGYPANDGQDVVRAASWNTVVQELGPGTAFSMPELRQALDNGVFELVVVPLATNTGARATVAVEDAESQALGSLTATAKGTWANDLALVVKPVRKGDPVDGVVPVVAVNCEVPDPAGGRGVVLRNASMQPGDANYLPDLLATAPLPVATFAVDIEWAFAVDAPLTIDAEASATLVKRTGDGGAAVITLTAGDDAIRVVPSEGADAATRQLSVQVRKGGDYDIVADSGDLSVPGDESALIRFLEGLDEDLPGLSVTAATLPWPAAGVHTLTGGTVGTHTAFQNALGRLVDQADVDLVMASVQDYSSADTLASIYGHIISHCNVMSADSKGRIGFGQVFPLGSTDATDAKAQRELVSLLKSDRFVLVVPHGYQGAVAGRIGSLAPHISPTFKNLSGLGRLHRDLSLEEQRAYLKSKFLPVITDRSRGTIVVHGLTTDGDQISVRRVADRAVRHVKAIGDLFIGKLNNEPGRQALKSKLFEALKQMEKDGAIVPSTDGSDPAFKVNVFSSQRDFALGIVRVDIAVRPVRAIDFIYATVLVQV